MAEVQKQSRRGQARNVVVTPRSERQNPQRRPVSTNTNGIARPSRAYTDMTVRTPYSNDPELTGDRILRQVKEARKDHTEKTSNPQNNELTKQEPAQPKQSARERLQSLRKRPTSIKKKIKKSAKAFRISMWIGFWIVFPLWVIQFGFYLFSLAGLVSGSVIHFAVSGAATVVSYIPLAGERLADWVAENGRVLTLPAEGLIFITTIIIVFVGILTLVSSWLVYTLTFVDSMSGYKWIFFVLCLTLYHIPIINFFPWTILWMIVVVLQQGKREKPV